MENKVHLTVISSDRLQQDICENHSTDLNFTITLSDENISMLKEMIEKLIVSADGVSSVQSPEDFSVSHKSFRGVEPLSELEAAVTSIMNNLGIPAHTKGYRYLRDAVVMSAENPELIGQVTKVLYPTIARAHNTTPVRVERVIRHAIENCCMKDNEAVNTYFSQCLSSNRGKPTNSEFIAILSDKIRMYA